MRIVRRLKWVVPTFLRPTLRRVVYATGIGQDRTQWRARRAGSRGQWARAAELWAEAIGSAPSGHVRPSWYAHLAWAQYKSGDYDRAIRTQRRALELDPRRAEWHHRIALMAQKLGDWEEVIRAYEQALAIDNGAAEWQVRLGRALERSHRVEEAVAAYRQALAAGGRPPRVAFSCLARLHRRRGQFEQATRVVEDGLRAHPGSVKLAREHAALATDTKDWVAAAERWERVLKLAPGVPRAQDVFAVGRALQAVGDHEGALDAFDTALDLLEVIDEPWAFEALAEWEFRWEYSHVRARSGSPQHRALEVETAPVSQVANSDYGEDGRFAVEITQTGALITGWLGGPHSHEVSLCVDGREFKQVDVKLVEGTWELLRPTFRYSIKHPTLDHFPTESVLSVRVNGAAIPTSGGASGVRLSVPHGDGALFAPATVPALLTKKGTLAEDVGPASQGRLTAMGSYALARDVFEERFKRPLFLLYGTLLGCVRDGDFIAGDDDLDVGFLSSAADPESMKAEALHLMDQLIGLGFDVGIRVSGGVFKLYIEERELDVYPVWFANGRAWAYSDIAATREDFAPLTTTEFKGVQAYLPASPESVLVGTYGPDWRIPRPSFRHYRPLEVRRILARTYVTPTEARALRTRNQREREGGEPIGRFLIGHSPDRPQIVPQRLRLRAAGVKSESTDPPNGPTTPFGESLAVPGSAPRGQ